MVALPNLDRTLRATLVLGERHLAETPDGASFESFLRTHLPDVMPFLVETGEQIRARPAGEITAIRVSTFHLADRVLLLGDAAHATVPFMGQGVNIGLEDGAVLAPRRDEHPADRGAAFAELTRRRLPEGLACADLSAANYRELTSGIPLAAGSSTATSVVAEVNFGGAPYTAVARQVFPGWAPRVVPVVLDDGL